MSAPGRASLSRRLFAEALGTALVVAVVVGSGISAQRLSDDIGVQLLVNSLATVGGLAVLILVMAPVSGAHFNPVVSVADWWLGRHDGAGLPPGDVAAYAAAQVTGGVVGAVLANAMYDLPLVEWSTRDRTGGPVWLAEAVATAGLVLVIFALARNGSTAQTAWAVGAYIGAAYFFTSSTSFANPAVTLARMFTDTFAGIAPTSAPGFIAAQVAGGAVGVAIAVGLYPDPVDR